MKRQTWNMMEDRYWEVEEHVQMRRGMMGRGKEGKRKRKEAGSKKMETKLV